MKKPKPVSALHEGIEALQAALEVCARQWGWWNPGDPLIIRRIPDHPMVRVVIDRVRREERARWSNPAPTNTEGSSRRAATDPKRRKARRKA